jgi:hypothetical protein
MRRLASVTGKHLANLLLSPLDRRRLFIVIFWNVTALTAVTLPLPRSRECRCDPLGIVKAE